MSTLKTTVLAAGLVIAAVVVFFVSGADQLVASAADISVCPALACDTNATGKSTSSCTRASAVSCPSAAALAGSGCEEACAKSCCGGKKAKSAAVMTPVPEHEGTRMVLRGRYVCGRCDLGVSETCQAAFHTTDGKNYLLVKNNLSKELKQTARDKDVEIVTRVQKYDGVKYLEVDVVRAL